MEVLESLEFGARAMSLRSGVTKPPEEIKQIQRSRLEHLVRHARTNSDFFRDKFAHIDDSAFELTDLPVSAKSELMDNFDDSLTVDDVRRDAVEEFFEDETNLGKYFRDKYVLSHTSGSQGQPMLLVQTKENIELLFALQVSRGNRHALSAWEVVKHVVSPARLAAVILKRGFYPSACALEYMPEGAKTYLDVLQLSLTNDDWIERLAEFRPTHLTAYASVLHELARQIEGGHLQLKPHLKQVVNISERLVPQARAHYAEVFGTVILDDYAMGECLFLTNGCIKTGGMHVNADWAILEVVDQKNNPVPDGTKGAKVLLTNLANSVQPIIRYEIGDVVTMSTEPCGCGSSLPLIQHIEGRDSDMFWIEGQEGLRPFTPAVFGTALDQVTEAREYQLIQEDARRFRIRLEPLSGVTVDRERVRRILHKQLAEHGLDGQLDIAVEIADRLIPEGGNKFNRVVRKAAAPKKNKQ
jgi:phenylacetate-coenzyme A ligase PaaK-like adenylate-forming protein